MPVTSPVDRIYPGMPDLDQCQSDPTVDDVTAYYAGAQSVPPEGAEPSEPSEQKPAPAGYHGNPFPTPGGGLCRPFGDDPPLHPVAPSDFPVASATTPEQQERFKQQDDERERLENCEKLPDPASDICKREGKPDEMPPDLERNEWIEEGAPPPVNGVEIFE